MHARAASAREWASTIDESFDVQELHLQSLDMFGPRVGFLKFRVCFASTIAPSLVVFANGLLCAGQTRTMYRERLVPGIVFMRGGAVSVLVVLRCEGRRYVVLCRQPRVPVGNTAFPEIPAGMLDGSGKFAGVAAKELQEETGIEIGESQVWRARGVWCLHRTACS